MRQIRALGPRGEKRGNHLLRISETFLTEAALVTVPSSFGEKDELRSFPRRNERKLIVNMKCGRGNWMAALEKAEDWVWGEGWGEGTRR
jgi:hypothetical protein